MITTLLYYPLNEAVQGWSYLLFIVPTALFLIILFFLLPETRFHYRSDLMESRLLADLGPPTPYGTFEDDELDLF
ncbi:unnamed protein product [Strongylus vulgaris]|uniref:Major facilitator superfamily (MFS) profile domain-containing protein n=1 Tax=Strongylus vulgaris TaxID=40348 RepID=A0A3P7JMR6_STRVU|nr:unnamed protein product [Strongylus vulgaris]